MFARFLTMLGECDGRIQQVRVDLLKGERSVLAEGEARSRRRGCACW